MAASVLMALAGNEANALPVAAGADCTFPHCYSILEGFNTTFIGMSGSWNRAYMSTPSDQTDDYFVDSEMWFVDANCQAAWVEEGLTVWWDPAIKNGAYESFWAYQNTGGTYGEFAIAYILPSRTTTDNYQISRSGSQTSSTSGGTAVTSRRLMSGFGQEHALRWAAKSIQPMGTLTHSTCMARR